MIPELRGAAAGAAAPVVAHLSGDPAWRSCAGLVRTRPNTGGMLGRLYGWLLGVGGIPDGARFRVETSPRGPWLRWRRAWLRGDRWHRATGHLRWDHARDTLVDSTGPLGLLEVDLQVSVEDGGVRLRSRGVRVGYGGRGLPLPRCLVGSALVREWATGDGRLGLSLTLRHPWLGDYAGYEALLTREDPT